MQVVEPFAVYHDGEQRSGTLHHVPADAAAYWEKHGWATVVPDAPNKPKAEPKTEAKPAPKPNDD